MDVHDRSQAPGTSRFTGGHRSARIAAGFALAVERFWPLILGLSCVLALFLILAWGGIFALMAPWLRIGALGLLVLAALGLVWVHRGLRLPSRSDVTQRVEAASRLSHQPLRAQEDSAVGSDPVAQALWRIHQRRMAERLTGLTGGAPNTRTERIDPYGLRALMALGVVTAFAYSYGPSGGRIADALAPVPGTLLAAARIDAWVTPPGYTGRAPLFLTPDEAGEVEVPAGSVLSVRVSDGAGVHFSFSAGQDAAELVPPAGAEAAADGSVPPAAADAPAEFDLELTRSGTARLETRLRTLGDWSFAVTPDHPPVIAFDGEPRLARNGAMDIGFTVEDDYGAPQGRALILPREPAQGARPLIEAPEINLAMPRRTKGIAKGRTTINLADSPYAGTPVHVTLTARDDAGQVGHSAPQEMILPQRPFSNPLALAVVEQRRILALDAHAARRVVELLDAVTLHGDSFIPRVGDYLALRAVRERIATARNDDDLRSAVDFLWEIALGIEDGDLSFAERRLRDAQERLSDALRDGASDEEIAALMQELRDAMNAFMQAMAEAMEGQPPQNLSDLGNAQEISPRDLQRMMDRIEDLARSGSRDAAQQLLSELQDMMNNLQMAQPGQGQQPGDSPMQQQMNEMGELLQRQQQLMDETFDLGRQQMRRQMEEGMEGMPQMPQTGEGGEPPSASELRERLEELQRQQGALQERLQALAEAMREQGLEPGEGMGRAGEAMGEAEGALGRGSDGEAVDRQGEALQALREGAQDMMRQMQEAMQGQPGQGNQPGQPGQPGQGMGQGMARQGRDDGQDPLGRPRQTQGPDFGNDIGIPEEIDIQRARRILDEIRNRLGNRLSPELEREYLERLLPTR
ncbi:TIGR02302 family protein [Aureimonas frigidaquae]|uniref:TIGR02302 family protein n=1 Tax=Aureimonas frigidaquae TaxID=424757 RepID=UPI00078278B0|nr:TIGR02302 family protein [Aureimonas frigidaquae]